MRCLLGGVSRAFPPARAGSCLWWEMGYPSTPLYPLCSDPNRVATTQPPGFGVDNIFMKKPSNITITPIMFQCCDRRSTIDAATQQRSNAAACFISVLLSEVCSSTMMQWALGAIVFSPLITQALLPHMALPRSVARPTAVALAMDCQQEHREAVAPRGETRGDVVRRVAEACLAGGSAWTCSTLGAAAKAPVMKLPDDDPVKPLQQSGNGGSIPPFTVLPSGVQIADIAVGEGAAAESGKGVTLKWVMRRSNGYYVSSSTEGGGEPFIFRVGDEKRAIKGLDEGIRGMKAGGTRRIVVPPQLAYVEGCQDGKPGPIPLGLGPKQQINTRKTEPLTFEVKLTKVR